MILGNYPDEDEEYQEWEYPDPDDIEDLDSFRDLGKHSSGGMSMSLGMKILGAIMIIFFIGSLLVPLLRFPSSGPSISEPSNSDLLGFEDWIEGVTKEIVDTDFSQDRIEFVEIDFPESTQSPVIAILVDQGNLDEQNALNSLQVHSIKLIQVLFADQRAENLAIVWVRREGVDSQKQPLGKVVLLVGITRDKSLGVNWGSLGATDLRYVVDYYEEYPGSNENIDK